MYEISGKNIEIGNKTKEKRILRLIQMDGIKNMYLLVSKGSTPQFHTDDMLLK